LHAASHYAGLPSGISGSSKSTSRTSREMAPRLAGLCERVGRAGRPVSGNGVAHAQEVRTTGRFSAGNGDWYTHTHTHTHLHNIHISLTVLTHISKCRWQSE